MLRNNNHPTLILRIVASIGYPPPLIVTGHGTAIAMPVESELGVIDSNWKSSGIGFVFTCALSPAVSQAEHLRDDPVAPPCTPARRRFLQMQVSGRIYRTRMVASMTQSWTRSKNAAAQLP